MLDLTDKTVFITGASAGIGAACAEAFASAGTRLLLCARRQDRLQDLADRLRSRHTVAIHTFVLDVRRSEAVEQAVADLPEAWRQIDILVNNAGLSKALDTVYENTIADIDAMVDTNVKGLLYVTRAVVPGMVARKRGHVINIGSTSGRTVYPGGTVYCATKFAVHALNMGMKMDLHGTGVRVSSVDPGLVETEFSIVRFEGDRDRADTAYAGMTPLTPEDVADGVLYCATRPLHVNINELVMMPLDQSAPTMVHRR